MNKKISLLLVVFVFSSILTESQGATTDFFENTYKPQFATGITPTANIQYNLNLDPKSDTIVYDGGVLLNGAGYEYIITYPNSANNSKILQALIYVENDGLNYADLIQFKGSNNIFYNIVMEKTGSSIVFKLKRGGTNLKTSPTYTIQGKYAVIDLIGYIVRFPNNLVEWWGYAQIYQDNGQRSFVWYDYAHSQESSFSLTNSYISFSYYIPNTNVAFGLKLSRYGSKSNAMNLYPVQFSQLLFESTIDINFKSFIKGLETLPYLEYTSLDLTNYGIPLNFNYTYYIVEKNRTTNEVIIVEKEFRLNYTYNNLQSTWASRKYYYDPDLINPHDWGHWGINNWLRDGLVVVLNSIITFLQFLLYLLVIAINYLLWIPIVFMIIILNNYILYGIIWIIVGIVFVVGLILLMIWEYMVLPAIDWLWYDLLLPVWGWIMQNIITPIVSAFVSLYNWLFKEGGLEILVNLYLTLVSYILAGIFLVLSGGLINYTETQQAIAVFLIELNKLFLQIGNIFIINFPILIGYSGVYILLVGLVYLKYIYAKSRGYTTRATKLQSMINVYKLPLVLLIRLSQYVVGFIQGGVPTDGADE